MSSIYINSMCEEQTSAPPPKPIHPSARVSPQMVHSPSDCSAK